MSHSSVVACYRPEGAGPSRVARSSIFAHPRPGGLAHPRLGPLAMFLFDLPARPAPRDEIASPTSPAGCMRRWHATSPHAWPRSMRSTPGSRSPHRPARALRPIFFPSNQWRQFHDGRRHPALRARPVQQHSGSGLVRASGRDQQQRKGRLAACRQPGVRRRTPGSDRGCDGADRSRHQLLAIATPRRLRRDRQRSRHDRAGADPGN